MSSDKRVNHRKVWRNLKLGLMGFGTPLRRKNNVEKEDAEVFSQMTSSHITSTIMSPPPVMKTSSISQNFIENHHCNIPAERNDNDLNVSEASQNQEDLNEPLRRKFDEPHLEITDHMEPLRHSAVMESWHHVVKSLDEANKRKFCVRRTSSQVSRSSTEPQDVSWESCSPCAAENYMRRSDFRAPTQYETSERVISSESHSAEVASGSKCIRSDLEIEAVSSENNVFTRVSIQSGQQNTSPEICYRNEIQSHGLFQSILSRFQNSLNDPEADVTQSESFSSCISCSYSFTTLITPPPSFCLNTELSASGISAHHSTNQWGNGDSLYNTASLASSHYLSKLNPTLSESKTSSFLSEEHLPLARLPSDISIQVSIGGSLPERHEELSKYMKCTKGKLVVLKGPDQEPHWGCGDARNTRTTAVLQSSISEPAIGHDEKTLLGLCRGLPDLLHIRYLKGLTNRNRCLSACGDNARTDADLTWLDANLTDYSDSESDITQATSKMFADDANHLDFTQSYSEFWQVAPGTSLASTQGDLDPQQQSLFQESENERNLLQVGVKLVSVKQDLIEGLLMGDTTAPDMDLCSVLCERHRKLLLERIARQPLEELERKPGPQPQLDTHLMVQQAAKGLPCGVAEVVRFFNDMCRIN